MTEGDRFFKDPNGKGYVVSESKAKDWLSRNPGMIEYAKMDFDGTQRYIPLPQLPTTLRDFPNATLAEGYSSELDKIYKGLTGTREYPQPQKYTPQGGMYTPQGSTQAISQDKEQANSIVQGVKGGTKQAVGGTLKGMDWLLETGLEGTNPAYGYANRLVRESAAKAVSSLLLCTENTTENTATSTQVNARSN